jgi:hypothetical protein
MKFVLAFMLSFAALAGGSTAAYADHIDIEVEDDAEAETLAVSGTGDAESDTVAVTALWGTADAGVLAVNGRGTAESDVVAASVFGNSYGSTTFSFFGDSCGTETSVSITGTAGETC